MGKKVVALVGSYRKGGATDSVVQAVLEGAREKGAQTETIYLIDRPIEFCTNCRQCMQQAGEERGKCVQQDGLEALLAELDAADSLVLGSPVNMGNVTAIFRRFFERLAGAGYWPWGQNAPTGRKKTPTRMAATVATSAMPGFLVPLFTNTGYSLRSMAQILGAKRVGSLWIGLAAKAPHFELSASDREKARRLGWKLA